jgi:hypothetical protein
MEEDNLTEENIEILKMPFGLALKAMSIKTMSEDKLEDDFRFNFPDVEFIIHVKNNKKWVEES